MYIKPNCISDHVIFRSKYYQKAAYHCAHRLCSRSPYLILVRPPVRSNGRSYKMLVMFLFFAAKSPSSLGRSPRTSPHDWNLCLFYKLTPKIQGTLPAKKLGAKTCKISVDFIQPPTLIANISGTAQDIHNLKTNSSTAVPPALHEKGRVNFGPLITETKM